MAKEIENKEEERFVMVRESFVFAAHTAACRDWKRQIEKELPDLFGLKYKPGAVFIDGSGQRFLLACYGSDENDCSLHFVNLKSGSLSVEITNLNKAIAMFGFKPEDDSITPV